MIKCNDFFNLCKKYNFTFFSGVPDSTFKSWMSFLEKNNEKIKNIVTVNECEAVAVCSGYHLSTGKIAVLYMQNSGLGKVVNPITSLCDQAIYSIPILLMIGWRGEPDTKDAYQLRKMGPITLKLLDLLDIPYKIISTDAKELEDILKIAKEYMEKNSRSFALIIRKNIFEKLEEEFENGNDKISREEALKTILKNLDGDEVIVSTTGKISRELFENRTKKDECSHDFYNIGAMGCAQSIALGISLQKKNKKVFVFDGDGSVLMQMGALATIGYHSPKNFYHIIFDNQSHDSTGGQPTYSDAVYLDEIAKACNYKNFEVVRDKSSLEKMIKKLKKNEGPFMLVIKVKKGARKNLGRPTMPPKKHKERFMKYIQEN
ncbi:MAG: phosphonopyruvate decarboxylase [Thermoplasmatales archaeon]|nr:MAG: phosphonopyruvate decarboxylase [Thermoplasmatales archaeon]